MVGLRCDPLARPGNAVLDRDECLGDHPYRTLAPPLGVPKTEIAAMSPKPLRLRASFFVLSYTEKEVVSDTREANHMNTGSYYDVGYICRNGHWINRRGKDHPEHNAKFCSQDGAEVISACSACNQPIRGDHVMLVGGVPVPTPGVPPVPQYCWNCGKPYPWSQA
jgi:hypothetical protein